MPSYDILTDIDNEENPFTLIFKGGDFLIEETSEQNIRLAMLSSKGNWKQHPLVGAEIKKMIHQSARTNYKQIITQALEYVGYKVTKFNGGTTSFNSELDFDIDVQEIV